MQRSTPATWRLSISAGSGRG